MSVLFVAERHSSREVEAAWAWLRSSGGGRARRVAAASLAAELGAGDVLWWHASAATPALEPDLAAALRRWLDGGGRLWLTLQALALLPQLSLEDRPPERLGVFAWRHAGTELDALEGERRGLVGFGPHPVFDGLQAGAFLLVPRPGRRYPEAVYTSRTEGRMVAAEWQYLAMDPSRRMALEYAPGAGRVLAVGAHLLFGEAANSYRPFLERFARNCLAYLAAALPAGEGSFWPAVDFAPPPAGGATGGVHAQPEDDPHFDVVGRRVAILGRQRTGVTEVWSPPLRLARNLRASFEADAPAAFRRTAEGVERTFDLGRARAVQRVSAGEVSYEVVAGALDSLELAFEVDLRWMWPYPEGVLGQPRVTVRGGELRLLDGAGVERGQVRFSPPPDRLETSGALCVRATFARPTRVEMAFAGWRLSAVEAGASRETEAVAVAEGDEPGEPLLALETPDADFNRQLALALEGLRAFDVESPAGRGLVAGWAETGSGWWSGRPGYAWYFGRDTCWSATGCLGAGLHEPVGESLRLMARQQRMDGKIFHELTPAGVAHFDAADSTPLFLVALERYLRWTGDRELVAELRPHAHRALAFCLSTDSDGDGLIENTGVGHGWAEGGRMHGAHATFYLNACWAAALESMASLAALDGDESLSARCRGQAARVRTILNTRLHRPEARWFAHGIDRAGRLMTPETMEPAVAALFGLLDPALTGHFFDQLASPRFSTPWGVRYVAADDPAYNPRGYHSGSVWPLFTGWAAAAEYACGRPQAGLAHVRASLALVDGRSLGNIDEVLNGDAQRDEGVCPHQLWSHAMTVAPLVEGLLGVRPDAARGRLTLAPQLPPEWDQVAVRGLRVGRHDLTLEYRRSRAGWEMRLDGQDDLEVSFVAAGQA